MNEDHTYSLQSSSRETKNAFAYSMQDLLGYSGAMEPFMLQLNTDKAIVQPPRQYSLPKQSITKVKTQELVDARVAYEHKEPTCCTVNSVVGGKKDPDTGLWTEHRITQDYHSVNQHTPHDKYDMHQPEIFQKVITAVVLSKLDLRQGFF